MNAIDDLVNEHEAVKSAIRILKRMCREIEHSAEMSIPEHLDRLLDFFTTFVDRCHHSKEEEQLFPALEEVGVSRDGGPVGVMLKEHQQGRDLVANMKVALDRYRKGYEDAAQEFITSANDYTTLLNFHIDKENDVLFPMALKHLSESKLAGLKLAFDRIEKEKIGAGKHEAFHHLLHSLEKTVSNGGTDV
jgi:hemerythrin-like domain-containing protein